MKKRCVLILDDLWEVCCLQDVGNPEPSCENGFKLVLTTRSLNVCRQMSCESIQMGLLPKKEARNLFLENVGLDVLCKNPKLEPTMNSIIEECAGLLAIVTVARSLHGVLYDFEWMTTLEELKNSIEGPMLMI